ncbi:unnamed protein product [Brachionus calyciflorus]|uniref:ARID domain-containing protein n=1 Tax=Brachionus calyciflorus TaxID=104777 RepID=A0A813NU34_9BILA|nr:unnamed protein product [Brachionus calyciflorus]
MEVQSTQNLSNNLNLKPSSSYVSSSSSSTNLPIQQSLPPTPPSASMIQNKIESLQTSALPTASPLNEQFNYNYHYNPMYHQYNQFAQTQSAPPPPPPPTSTQPGGYPNYNYFYQPNGQIPAAAPKNPAYFYNQQFNPNDQNNAYLNGQYNNPNTQQSNTSLNDLIKHNNLNNNSPGKMDTPSKQKKSKTKNDKTLNGTSNGNEDIIKKDKSPSKKNDKQKSPLVKRKPTNSKTKKKDDKELNNNQNTNENVSPNKNDKNSKSTKKKPGKKKTEIEEKESSDESDDDENDDSEDDHDEDDDDDEDGDGSNEEEEEQIKTPKTKSPKKPNKTTPKRQISTSISSSSSSTLSDENSSEKISKLSEENTNEDSTSSSNGSLKSKNSQSSSLSFNINNILSKPQANPETQMLPPPSPSNGSTSSSTNSNNLLKHPPNVPSPSNSTSSASSSPAQTANFHKPNLNSNMQYQMWKNQSQNNQMYPHPHHQHQPMPPMFPPPNDPNFYAYHQQMLTKTMSPSPMDQERPPSTKTPQINEYPNPQKLQQTPTTPQNLNLNNNQTPRSPVVNLNNSQMAMSSQHGFTTDNSNMSFTQDHDDENSMMSDEMSSPKNNNSHQSHGGHSAKSLAHNAEVLAKLIEIGKETNDDTPERKDFVQKLQKIWEDNSIVCRSLPTVNKHLLDLYKFYCLVKARGGFSDVNKQKLWKDISSCLDMGNTAPIALILKRKYASIGLVHYECKYDLNGADPLPLIADIEKSTSKSKKQTEQNTLTSSNSNSNLSNASNMTPAKKTKKSNGKDKKDKNSTDTPPPPPLPPSNTNNTQTASPSIQFPNQPPNNQAMMPPQVVNNPQMNPHFPQNDFNQQTHNQQIMNHGYPQMNPQQQQQQQQQYYGQPRPPYPPYQYPGQQNMMRYPMPVQQQQQQQPQQPQQPTVQPPSQNPAQVSNNQMMPPPPIQQHPQMPYPMQQPFNNQMNPAQMNQPMMPYGPQVPGQQQPPYPQPTAQPGQHPQMVPQPQMVQQQAPIPQMNPNLQRPIQEQSMSPAPPPQQQQQPPPQTPNQQAQAPPPPPPQSQPNSILSSKLSNPSSSPSPLMSLNQMSQNLGPTNLQPPPPPQPPVSQPISQPQPVQQPNQQQMPSGPTMNQMPPHLQQQMRGNMQPHPHPANPQQFPGHLPQHLAHHHHHPPSSHLPPTQPQPQSSQHLQQQYHPQMSQNIPPQTQPQPHMPPIQPQPSQQQPQHPMLQQKPPHMLMQQQQQQQPQLPNQLIQQQIQNNQIIQQAQQRIKETQFPPESVEATIPNESKKRKICAKDIGPCDPWKLYMSLKSGLLAESTWALDALNILLYDDQTISYFHLSHFPGLVNTLLEYFLKCLKILFNEFTDLEIVHYPFQNKLNKENEYSESDDEQQQQQNDVKKIDCKKLNGFHIDSLISDKKSKKADSQILKVNFSDKDIRNRFNHYYSNKNNKVVKFNDSRANCEWVEYNQDLLDKFNCNVNTTTTNNNNTKKRKLRKSKSSNLDNFIQTNFNSNHEWDDLEKKLFFGDFYSHFQNDDNKMHQQKFKLEMKTNNTNKIIQPNDDPNYEFVKRHQNHLPSENNLNKKLDDQIVEDEDKLFKIVSQRNQELMNRCSIISTIIRNLSFVPGNDVELCKSTLLIDILSRLLILKHEHSLNDQIIDQSDDDNDDEDITGYDYLNDPIDCIKFCKEKNLIYKKRETSVSDKNVWWWECIQLLRENTLVSLANISGALNLNNLDENIIEIYSHGLIHWVICKSNEALDPLSTTSETNMLSPQRLSIEILSKLSINDINIDLICANMIKMRPFLDSFVHVLCNEYLTKRDEQTLREFSIVLLSALAKSGQFTSRSIAKYTSSFLSFIEDFEEIARRFQLLNPNHLHYHPNFIQSSHNQNQNNPNLRLLNEDISNINEENLGTTIDMLRRCANTIACLSVYSENGPFILKYENRILDLVTSQFVDFKVAQILSEVLFNCSKCN